jgi:transmembrane sensor
MSDERLRSVLRDPTSEARVRTNWEGIGARRVERRARARAARIVVRGAATLAVVAAALVLWSAEAPSAGAPLRTASAGVIPDVLVAQTEPSRLDLEDGSWVRLRPRSRVELLENGPARILVGLRQGAMRLQVTPGGPRRWVVEAGLANVEIVGTELSIERSSRRVRVEVHHGAVLVRGPTVPDGVQRVSAGQTLDVMALDAAPARAVSNGPMQETGDAVGLPRPSEEERLVQTEGVPELVHEQRADAPRAVRRPAPTERPALVEPIDPPSETVTSEETAPAAPRPRITDADALRSSGRLAEAADVLAQIAADPDDARDGAIAAFTWGRLELDRLDRPARAARAFERAIALGLPPSLLEDARAARVQAYSRVPDARAARRAAAEYREHHPTGRWRPEVDRWLGDLDSR